jgi:hypothetical protein
MNLSITKLALGISVFGALIGGSVWLIRERNKVDQPSCTVNLKIIDGAKEHWAIERKKMTGDTPTWTDLREPNGVLRVIPKCPENGTYTIGKIGELPKCSISSHERYWENLNGVTFETNSPLNGNK